MNILVIIAYLLSLGLMYYAFREVYKLIINMLKKKFIYGNYTHSLEHIIIMFLIVACLITMLLTCGNEQKIPIIAYTLIMILFIIPHLTKERKE